MSAPTLAEQRTLPPDPTDPSLGEGHARTGRTSVGAWLGILAMSVAAVALLGFLITQVLHDHRGLRLDQRLMESVGDSATAAMRISGWLTYVSVAGVALALGVCVVVAVVRRRFALAVAAAVLVIGANVTTRLLKLGVLDRIDGERNTLPSGHTTVALSLGLAAVLVAPAAWRWVVVPLAGFAGTFVGAGTVIGQWHRPSDVLAAIAVCLGWAAVALAIALVLQRSSVQERVSGAAHPALALVGSALVGLCFVVWGLRPQDHDVELVRAVLALGSIGVLVAAAVASTAALTQRHVG